MSDQLYTSLGGSDIHAVFGNYKFGSIQMIRYAVSREKAQIYTLGSPSARATARGKRSVSGAFVFTLIDRKGLVKAMAEAGGDTNGHVFLNNDEIANFANSANQAKPTASKDYKDSLQELVVHLVKLVLLVQLLLTNLLLFRLLIALSLMKVTLDKQLLLILLTNYFLSISLS